jgi:hypothetical protein
MSLILKAPFVRNWKDDEERIVQIVAAPAGADTYQIIQGYFPSYDAILSQSGMKMFTLEVKMTTWPPASCLARSVGQDGPCLAMKMLANPMPTDGGVRRHSGAIASNS